MNENFTNVGERIALKINEMGLKQTDITKATGISKNAVSNYVNGNRIPDTLSIFKLAKFFNVSIEWLLTGENPVTSHEESLNEDENELLQLFRKLPLREQMRTIGYIESNVEKHSQKEQSSNSISGEEAATDETA